MDQLKAMQVFVRVAQLGGFTRAAQALGLSRAATTAQVQRLEAHLGATLLQRTTRRVRLTADGAAYLPRAEQVLSSLAELDGAVRGATQASSGRLRVDVPAAVGRHVLAPALPDFFRLHPRITLELGSTDRAVDLVGENVDCVIRGGALHDASLIRRRLGALEVVTVASPAYLKRAGTPKTPEALARHTAVNFFSARTGEVFSFDFEREGKGFEVSVPHQVACNDADTFLGCGLAGLGVLQLPRTRVVDAHLRAGRLKRILTGYGAGQLELFVLYPPDRHLSQRVRAFIDWVTALYRSQG